MYEYAFLVVGCNIFIGTLNKHLTNNNFRIQFNLLKGKREKERVGNGWSVKAIN